MDEPFQYWCDKILSEIYEECNRSPFMLHFSSRQEERHVMEVLAGEYPHCMQYSSSSTQRPDSLQKRMMDLSRSLKENPNVRVKKLSRSVLFVIPESLRSLENELLSMEVVNSFCNIESCVTYYQEYYRAHDSSDFLFLISDEKDVKDIMSRLNIGHDFGLQIVPSGKSSFLTKDGKMFIYRTTKEELFQTIFECLMLTPLLEIFLSCIKSLPVDFVQSKYKEIEILQSISAKLISVVDSNTIELGRSVRIHFDTDSSDYKINISQLRFSYSEKGVIQCNGLVVEGLREGKVTLYVYKQGENDPCTSIDFNVIRRNRIIDLTLEQENLLIGEGDSVHLGFTYLPADADNVKQIIWQSDDTNVATVDSVGNVRGKKKGTCNIRCFAEQVSACCRCVVKPHLQKITAEAYEIDMIQGQVKTLYIKLYPENCIDDQIVVSSMDVRIVKVSGRTIQSVGLGSTRIVIQNRQETVRVDINVNVFTERQYKKRQKQKLKEQNAAAGKQGWITKLFG